MATFATGINAQLVVDSLGRVGVGTEAPKSMLSVGLNSDTLSAISCRTPYKTYGIYSKNNFTKVDNDIYSIYSISDNSYGQWEILKPIHADKSLIAPMPRYNLPGGGVQYRFIDPKTGNYMNVHQLRKQGFIRVFQIKF